MILKSNIGHKSQYWQIIRGICILAVVLIHCPANQNLATMEGTIWLILRKCINFPVAVFVFLAGYFTKTEGVQKDTKAYLLNRGGV